MQQKEDGLYVGMLSPNAHEVVATRRNDADTFDFMTVSAASMKITKPDGTKVVWSTGLTAQSSAGLTARHSFVAGDLDQAGTYRVWLLMTVPGGSTRTEVDKFHVKEEDAT